MLIRACLQPSELYFVYSITSKSFKNMNDHAKSAIVSKYDTQAERYADKDFIEVGGELFVYERPSAYFFVKRKVDYAMQMSRATRDMHLLEVGCSLGQMTILLATRFNAVKAIDLSPKCVEMNTAKFANRGFTNVSFAVDDAEELATVEDNSMDLAFSFSVIRYCSDTQKAVNAVHAKLKPGSVAVIDFPNRRSPWHWIVKKSIGIEKHVNDHLFTRTELQQMFEAAGFVDIEMKNILFIPRALPNAWFPLFKVINNIFEHIPLLNRFSGVIMVKGQKHDTSKNSVGSASV